MSGGHDLGGQQGLGPIKPEPEAQEPVFHEEWERRVFALTMAAGMLGRWNIDQSRHARERQHPADYLNNWQVLKSCSPKLICSMQMQTTMI